MLRKTRIRPQPIGLGTDKEATMRVVLAAAAMAGAAAAEPFDIILVQQADERTLVVHDENSGRTLVFVGNDDLRPLEATEAEETYRRLVEQGNCGSEPSSAGIAPAAPPRIKIHKMDYDEDPIDVRGDSQTRVPGRDRVSGDLVRHEAEPDANGLNAAGAEAARSIRLIRLTGAAGAEASRFIDDVTGIDPAAAAEIGEMLGL